MYICIYVKESYIKNEQVNDKITNGTRCNEGNNREQEKPSEVTYFRESLSG